MDAGATCDNRGRASVAGNSIRRPPSVVDDELEDTNEATLHRILQGSEDNRLEDEADSECDEFSPFHTSQRRYTATVSGGEKWEIKQIRKKRFVGVGQGKMRMQYWVQWGRSWVDAEDVDAPELIQDFEAAQRPKLSSQSQAGHAAGRRKDRELGRSRGRGRPHKARKAAVGS